MNLINVTSEGLVFETGSTVKVAPLPERITIPQGAETAWDGETSTLTVTVTTPTEVEGEEPTVEVTDYVLTQQEIDDAWAWTPPPAVPSTVTRVQLKIWLALNGHDVDAVIAAMPAGPEKTETEIRWNEATEFDRNNPLIEQLGAALGLDSAAIDQAFREAAQL